MTDPAKMLDEFGLQNAGTLIHQFSIPYTLLELSFDGSGRPEDYVYLALNDAYEEMCGMTRQQLIGKSCKEIYGKVDLDWLSLLHDVAMTKENTRLFDYDSNLNKYLEISVLSPQENVVACAYFDITEFITANKELEKNRKTIDGKNKFLKEVMDGVGNPLWVVEKRNDEFVYVESNEVHRQLTGIDLKGKKEVKVEELLKRYGASYVESVVVRYQECADDKKRVEYEEKITVNGKDIWNLTTLSPQLDGKGNVYRIICSALEITHRKKAEEEIIAAKEKAMEADRLKTVFLANMSHEIRTPLNSIIGFSELISDGDLEDAEREDMCRIIERNSTQLMKLINDIIEISKVESEQLKVVYKDFDLNRLMDDLSHDLEIEMYRKKKVLPVMVGKGVMERPIFSSDEYRIKQIFDHLINNALKFTMKGQIEFGYQLLDEEQSVLFYVKDTGIGIEKDKQDAIFDLFRQIDDNSTRRYAGTGLGLTLCKRITNILGGRMWVESELGKGSTFFFSIPKREQ